MLVELLLQNKEKFATFLEIQMSFCNKSDKLINYDHISRAPWEVETSPVKYSQKRMRQK